MRSISRLIFACIFGLAVSAAFAAPPELQTPSPVIYLADNLDEKDNLGWCIDTLGRGLSVKLQAHSCKPNGGDVQFRFDSLTGRINSVVFKELCASYSGSLPLDLVECSDTAAQEFSYDEATGTIRPARDPEDCLVVGSESRSAGPYMSRNLDIKRCNETDDLLKTWVIKP